jgi:hypothetical protein
MHLPVLPSFDQVLVTALGAAGFPAAALFLIATAFAVKSWADAARQARRGITAAVYGVRVTAQAVRQVSPGQRVSRITVTALVPCAQLILLAFCYVIGNFLSLLVSSLLGRHRNTPALTHVLGYPVQPGTVTVSGLHLDFISSAYLLFGIVCLGHSYRLALCKANPDPAGQLLAQPVTALGRLGSRILLPVAGFIVIGVALNLGAQAVPGSRYRALPVPALAGAALGFCVVALVLATLYYAACIAGARASRLLVNTWSPPSADAVVPIGQPQKLPLREHVKDYLFWAEYSSNKAAVRRRRINA